MSQMIDWEYYSSHFPTPIPERKFGYVEEQAELEFRRVVKPYMLSEISEERQKDCIFQLCNFIYSNAGALAGKALSSVSNRGYSESYVTGSEDVRETMRELIYECCDIRLAGVF